MGQNCAMYLTGDSPAGGGVAEKHVASQTPPGIK
jgi:hypothetical protein